MSLMRAGLLVAASTALHLAAVALGVLIVADAGARSPLIVHLRVDDESAAGTPAPAITRMAVSPPASSPRGSDRRVETRGASAAPADPVRVMPGSRGGELPAIQSPTVVAREPARVATSAGETVGIARALDLAPDSRPAPGDGAPPKAEPPAPTASATGGQPGATAPPAGARGGAADPSGAGSAGGGLARSGPAAGGVGAGGGARLALALPGNGGDGLPAEYGAYLSRFRRSVQDALRYPLAARRQGLSGVVQLEVMIDAKGRVQSVEVAASSSHAVLDEAAVDAVSRLAPLPFPEDVPARALRVWLPLVFQIEEAR